MSTTRACAVDVIARWRPSKSASRAYAVVVDARRHPPMSTTWAYPAVVDALWRPSRSKTRTCPVVVHARRRPSESTTRAYPVVATPVGVRRGARRGRALSSSMTTGVGRRTRRRRTTSLSTSAGVRQWARRGGAPPSGTPAGAAASTVRTDRRCGRVHVHDTLGGREEKPPVVRKAVTLPTGRMGGRGGELRASEAVPLTSRTSGGRGKMAQVSMTGRTDV